MIGWHAKCLVISHIEWLFCNAQVTRVVTTHVFVSSRRPVDCHFRVHTGNIWTVRRIWCSTAFFYRCGKLNLDTPGTPRRDCRLLLIRWASTREEIQQHVKAKTGTATYDRNILLLCVMCVSIIAEISVWYRCRVRV